MRRWIFMVAVLGVLSGARADPLFDLQPNTRWEEGLRAKSAEVRAQREAQARERGAYGCLRYCERLDRTFARVLRIAIYQLAERRSHDWALIVTRVPGDEAWALPDGHIFISEDFITRDGMSEEELAFVLAHEISHVLLAHEADMVDVVRHMVPFGVTASVADVYAALDYDMGLVLRVAPLMTDMELEADRVGLLLAALAGVDPDRAIGFLRRLAAGPQQRSLVATHPENVQRLIAAEAYLPMARRLYARHQALAPRAGEGLGTASVPQAEQGAHAGDTASVAASALP